MILQMGKPMVSMDVMRTEAAHYRALAEQLKRDYSGIDDETLADTLLGLSELPEMIEALVRSSLDDHALMEALKLRLEEMNERLSRFRQRFEKKRALACWAMGSSGIDKVQAEDFSVGLRFGGPRLEVVEEAKVPEVFLVPQPPKVDRTKLSQALKAGEVIAGAILVPGEPHIAVRTR
jgi:hypothetical protein